MTPRLLEVHAGMAIGIALGAAFGWWTFPMFVAVWGLWLMVDAIYGLPPDD